MKLPGLGDLFENRYRVDGVLGEGGFAVVYRATDTASSRTVALKVLRTHGDRYDHGTAVRFAREVEIVAQLRNAHTVRVLDSGRSSTGVLFAVFELVPGRDLAEILTAHGALEPDLVVHIVRQILQSLREAHGKGLLHRDIKPENIRVFEDRGDLWFVKLLDFGIARPADSSHPSVTTTGELVGTPRYMSPEQIIEGRLTAASDVYSVGMVAIELLLGRDALQGNEWIDQLDRLTTGHLFDIPESANIDEELRTIVERMTARDASQRYRSAGEVLTALDRRDGRGPAPRPTAPRPRYIETRPALPWHKILVAVAFALLGLSASFLWWVVRQRAPEEPAPPDLQRAAKLLHNMPAAKPAPAKPREPEPPVVGAHEVTRGRAYMRDSIDKEWLTYIPQGYDEHGSYPLLVLLHQSGETPEALLTATGFEAMADEHHFLIVAPEDKLMWAWRLSDEDAIRTIRHVVEEVSNRLAVDRTRVFLVGEGSGGKPAMLLACQPWVTAVATNSYRLATKKALCEPAVRKPIMVLSPTASGHEPLNGGKTCSGEHKHALEDMERMWRKRNRCKGERHETFRKGASACYTWDCAAPFQSCVVDGGHPWPGASPRLDLAHCDGDPPDFPTSQQIWTFLAKAPPLPAPGKGESQADRQR